MPSRVQMTVCREEKMWLFRGSLSTVRYSDAWELPRRNGALCVRWSLQPLLIIGSPPQLPRGKERQESYFNRFKSDCKPYSIAQRKTGKDGTFSARHRLILYTGLMSGCEQRGKSDEPVKQKYNGTRPRLFSSFDRARYDDVTTAAN